MKLVNKLADDTRCTSVDIWSDFNEVVILGHHTASRVASQFPNDLTLPDILCLGIDMGYVRLVRFYRLSSKNKHQSEPCKCDFLRTYISEEKFYLLVSSTWSTTPELHSPTLELQVSRCDHWTLSIAGTRYAKIGSENFRIEMEKSFRVNEYSSPSMLKVFGSRKILETKSFRV